MANDSITLNRTKLWKRTAIIFIIICVLETLFILWAYNLGNTMIENEYTCSINICADYDAYIYDDSSSQCSCYIDNELKLTRYMNGK